MALMGILGYNKKTGFKAGMTVAQVSEFSLILVVLGNRVGHLPPETVSLVTAVAIITITISTYYILYSDKLYEIFAPVLSLFERAKTKKERASRDTYDVVLFGFDHVGHDFIHSFAKLSEKFLVVDYNPEITKQLTDEQIPCRYGDASDNEFLDELNLNKAKMVVSTIADHATTSVLLAHIRRNNKKAVVIVHSDNIEEAAELYDNGATYVMMPHYLGATRTSALIGQHGFDLSQFIKERERHLHYIERRRTTAPAKA
jgi:voltage-gated potassium channel Kch